MLERPLFCQLNPLLTSHRQIGVVLSGGGARAAYQVGVLAAINDWLGEGAENPFKVILGTSAGAINAVCLAAGAQNFSQAIYNLREVWQSLNTSDVYRTDWAGVSWQAVRFIWQHILGLGKKTIGPALLDQSPLRQFLKQHIDFELVRQSIEKGDVSALGVTAFAYGSGQSVTFYQSNQIEKSWVRYRREGHAENITLEHLMASTAIPLIFSPIALNGEFYGDGALRQVAPLSPALHLGANRVLVISVGNPAEPVISQTKFAPSLAQITGQLLNSTFTDNLDSDLERLNRLNDITKTQSIRSTVFEDIGINSVDALVISPSQNLDLIAAKHRQSLPYALKPLLKGSGISQVGGGGLLSYVLFESSYSNELIELGYKDAEQQREKVLAFLQC